MSELLFVYGTLMRGSRHPMARELEAHATYLDDASYRGRLYRISTYPGIVLVRICQLTPLITIYLLKVFH